MLLGFGDLDREYMRSCKGFVCGLFAGLKEVS